MKPINGIKVVGPTLDAKPMQEQLSWMERLIERNRKKTIGFKPGFWPGFLFAAACHMAYQDSFGSIDRYIEHVRANWIDLSVWVGVISAVCWLLLGLRVKEER